MEALYTTDNISFRKVDKQDINDLISLKNESWFGTHTISLVNGISQEKWLEEISLETHCPRNLVLVASTENCLKPIGIFKIFNIDWQNHKAEVGWDVYKEYRGMGLGKKIVQAGVKWCFMALNLRRLDAQILATNSASIKCAEAAGFIVEGHQKEVVFRSGRYIDNLLFGILKNG